MHHKQNREKARVVFSTIYIPNRRIETNASNLYFYIVYFLHMFDSCLSTKPRRNRVDSPTIIQYIALSCASKRIRQRYTIDGKRALSRRNLPPIHIFNLVHIRKQLVETERAHLKYKSRYYTSLISNIINIISIYIFFNKY